MAPGAAKKGRHMSISISVSAWQQTRDDKCSIAGNILECDRVALIRGKAIRESRRVGREAREEWLIKDYAFEAAVDIVGPQRWTFPAERLERRSREDAREQVAVRPVVQDRLNT